MSMDIDKQRLVRLLEIIKMSGKHGTPEANVDLAGYLEVLMSDHERLYDKVNDLERRLYAMAHPTSTDVPLRIYANDEDVALS